MLQECAYVQQTIDSLGPVPQAISESWGEAWAQRVEQATSQPLLLQLDDGESCEVVVVGVNHRDPSNLAFILEIAQATQPDAVALEARAGFLDTYRQLTAAVPPQLLERVAWMPLTGGLQVCARARGLGTVGWVAQGDNDEGDKPVLSVFLLQCTCVGLALHVVQEAMDHITLEDRWVRRGGVRRVG